MDQIAILAPLGGATDTLRRFATVDRDNLDEVLLRLGPTLHLHVWNMKLDLRFRSMDDFEPAAVLAQCEPLASRQDGDTSAWPRAGKEGRTGPRSGRGCGTVR